MEPQSKVVVRFVLAGFMLLAGVGHFVNPAPFLAIVPSFLPEPLLLVYVSGVAEIAGGIGILVPKTRRLAGYGLIALFIAVYPANIYHAVMNVQMDPANPVPAWVPWVRLPFQAVFIWLAWWTSKAPAEAQA
jgi:uncharacterized membrane protein